MIAGGVLATALGDWRAAGDAASSAQRSAGPAGRRPPGRSWLPRVLAAIVVLYALQTLYSDDFSKGLQNVCFFFVPFSLAFALLLEVRWDRRLLAGALVGRRRRGARSSSLVGLVEYASRELLWNDAVIRSNEFHIYFRVNSLFWDPNIYGRYLALVIVVADGGAAVRPTAPARRWRWRRRSAVLWLGLATTFSQSSFAALLAGLAVLAALRWSLRWTRSPAAPRRSAPSSSSSSPAAR